MKILSSALTFLAAGTIAWASGGGAEAGVAWKKNWDEALQEARVRNAPIHISWHKDG